jgi:membrane-associated phospholipid phosphatase
MTRSLIAATFAIAFVVPATARAENDEHRLLHTSIVIGGAIAYLASETVLKVELAPSGCRWCDDNTVDRGVRDAVVWKHPQTADTISDILAFGATPAIQLGALVVAGRDERPDDDDAFLSDGLAVAEAVVVAGLLNQTVKFAVGRQRPYARVAAPGVAATIEDNLSFYSGHSTLGFTLAAATGTVAQMRGYRWAPWIWTGGVALASTTAYLCMAGDRHWLSDIGLGAALGTAVGIAIPRLAHRHLSGGGGSVDVRASAAPGIVLLSGSF